MDLRNIMVSHLSDIDTLAPSALARVVKSEAKANVGKGISADYYEKAFGQDGYITSKNIVGCIANAAKRAGVWAFEKN